MVVGEVATPRGRTSGAGSRSISMRSGIRREFRFSQLVERLDDFGYKVP